MPISRSSLILLSALGLSVVFACEDKSQSSASSSSSSAAASAIPAAAASSAAVASAMAATGSAMASASAAPSASAPVASASAVASAMAASAAPSGSAAAAPTCGKKPLPDCPLQGWMKANTSSAMSAQDFPGLEKALTQIVNFAPPGYSNWASISRDGAKAAHDQSLDGVKASCKGCHNQYQKKYRDEMRARKI